MGYLTKIEWCDHTFNPWWGCVEISPGCKNCYAHADAKRYGHGQTWGANGRRRFFSDKRWNEPRKWDAEARNLGVRRRVFSGSMCDVLELLAHDHPDHRTMHLARRRLMDLVEATPNLDWLLLTKRPENATETIGGWFAGGFPPNVHVGVTAERQTEADERIPILQSVPCSRRFVSAEPLLERLDLGPYLIPGQPAIHQVIVGGESGARARPFDASWARDLRQQCGQAGVAFFMKQFGRRPNDRGELIQLRHRKGSDYDEFPAELRLRELPAPMAMTDQQLRPNRS